MPSDSPDLLARARSGDRAAFDALVGAVGDRVRAFIRSRLRDEGLVAIDADELLQDALVRASGSIASFRGDDAEAFRRWLTGVANKTVLRVRDEARRRRTLELHADVAGKYVSPSKAMRRDERFDRLQGAFDALTGDHREVIFLTRIEGLTLARAAERMGRSPEAVKKLFSRALAQLRKRMADTASLHLPDRPLEWEGDDGRL